RAWSSDVYSSDLSSMHSPTVFPRISSQGSSSLVKICLHSWQIVSQLPPLENEKSTPPRRAGIFIKCIPPPLLTSSSGDLFSRSGPPNGYEGSLLLPAAALPPPRRSRHDPRRFR